MWKRSYKQHTKYFNFRRKIQLDHHCRYMSHHHQGTQIGVCHALHLSRCRTFSSCSSSSVSTPSLGTEDDDESAASTWISPALADFIFEVSTPLMVLQRKEDTRVIHWITWVINWITQVTESFIGSLESFIGSLESFILPLVSFIWALVSFIGSLESYRVLESRKG